MNFNTNHLGYKLFTGKLKENRKHSEQLNKFVAGFFDADGSVTTRYDGVRRRLSAEITQSNKVDRDGKLLKALQDFYGIGKIRYRKAVDAYTWYLLPKETAILFNLIGKHLIVKRAHYQSMLDYYDNKQYENLKELREESRKTSCGIYTPKHISKSYLAGLICGDGYICSQLKEEGKKKNQLFIRICLHEMDAAILDMIKKDYGGRIITRKNGLIEYTLSLGKGSYKAFQNVKPIIEYLLLDYKYNSFQKMIDFHKVNAETKRIDTER